MPDLHNRNKEIRKVRVGDLVENPANFKTHPQDQQDALAGVVEELGWFGYPDVFETADGSLMLSDGHLRKSYLIERYGEDTEIDVNVTDFDEEDAKKALLTKDPLTSMADVNQGKFDKLFDSIEMDHASIRLMLDEIADTNVDVELGAAVADSPNYLTDEEMELRPDEHYDYIVILADDVNDWNRLVSLFKLKVVSSQRTHRRLGLGRAVSAKTVLGLIDHDS